jgi:hypothetical protein
MDFRGTLEVRTISSLRPLDNHTHGFALRREGEHLHNIGSATSLLGISPIEFLRKLKERSLSLAANKNLLARVGFVVLESRRIDCNSFIEEVLQLREKNLIEVGLVNREGWLRVAAPEADFSVSSAFVRTLFSSRTRTKFAWIPTEPATTILGQRAHLVDTDNRCIGHGFTRTQDADKQILVRHSLRCENQSQGPANSKW